MDNAPNVEAGLGWMAWTWQTALFFGVIVALLVVMAVLEWRKPGGAPRRGSRPTSPIDPGRQFWRGVC